MRCLQVNPKISQLEAKSWHFSYWVQWVRRNIPQAIYTQHNSNSPFCMTPLPFILLHTFRCCTHCSKHAEACGYGWKVNQRVFSLTCCPFKFVNSISPVSCFCQFLPVPGKPLASLNVSCWFREIQLLSFPILHFFMLFCLWCKMPLILQQHHRLS